MLNRIEVDTHLNCFSGVPIRARVQHDVKVVNVSIDYWLLCTACMQLRLHTGC